MILRFNSSIYKSSHLPNWWRSWLLTVVFLGRNDRAFFGQAIDCPNGFDEPMTCENGACSDGASEECILLCSGVDTCAESSITQSIVECQNMACQESDFRQVTAACYGARWTSSNDVCLNAHFVLSNVTCVEQTGCERASFLNSHVDCTDSGGCDSAQFWASAVQGCALDRCSDARFFRCSCCDGDGCPDYVASCEDEDFCTTAHNGKTCQEWGNPKCDDNQDTIGHLGMEVVDNVGNLNGPTTCNVEEDFPITYCDSQQCSNEENQGCAFLCSGVDTCDQAIFLQSIVECRSLACQNAEFRQSTVSCLGGRWTSNNDVCLNGQFYRSDVQCSGQTGCDNASFEESVVDCSNNGACASAQFEASAVKRCAEDRCSNSSFLRCSCCDGDGCPDSVPSCNDENFCSMVNLGKTCEEWGNPICGDNMLTIGHGATTASLVPSGTPSEVPSESPSSKKPFDAPSLPPTTAPTVPSQTNVPPPTNTPAATMPVVLTEVTTTNTAISIELDSNDSGGDDVTIIDEPLNGQAVIQDDSNAVSYVPNPGFVGTDEFSCRVCNNNSCTIIALTITVEQRETLPPTNGSLGPKMWNTLFMTMVSQMVMIIIVQV